MLKLNKKVVVALAILLCVSYGLSVFPFRNNDYSMATAGVNPFYFLGWSSGIPGCGESTP
ncbi:MAG: hypothetical protein ACFFAO_09295 [Candidatus Hermodarchaeota archaeon]